jgi:hypothetical protein
MPEKKKAAAKPRKSAQAAPKPKAEAPPAEPIDELPPAKPKKDTPPPPVSKSLEMLQRKRAAQRAKAELESTTAQTLGRGPASNQGRGPSGRTRGPVKK